MDLKELPDFFDAEVDHLLLTYRVLFRVLIKKVLDPFELLLISFSLRLGIGDVLGPLEILLIVFCLHLWSFNYPEQLLKTHAILLEQMCGKRKNYCFLCREICLVECRATLDKTMRVLKSATWQRIKMRSSTGKVASDDIVSNQV